MSAETANRATMESIGAGGAGYERAGVMAVIEVEIGPGPVPGQFRVKVIDSPVGHPSAVAHLDAGSLMTRRGLLQQEVLASAVRARGAPETEQFLREAGQALFAGLLGAGGVAGCYRASAALAAERGEELRVVLRIEEPMLAGLPWEAMFDDEMGAYVCRRDQLVRHVPSPRPRCRCRFGRRCGSWASPRPPRAGPAGRGGGEGAPGPRPGPAGLPGPGRGPLGAGRDLGRPAGRADGRGMARAALRRAR